VLFCEEGQCVGLPESYQSHRNVCGISKSSRRQRSGVQAKACPDCGWGTWGGPPTGRLGPRPSFWVELGKDAAREHQESLPLRELAFPPATSSTLASTSSSIFLDQPMGYSSHMTSFIKAQDCLIKICFKSGEVGHICNPSYSGGGDWEDGG
jgi:hypothetical protein